MAKHIKNERELKKIIDSRIEFARRDSGSLPEINMKSIRELILG